MDNFFKFLNSDRYQYTESEIYLKNNMEDKIATFDVFIRTEKEEDYGVVYGIEEVIGLIKVLNFTSYEEKKKYLLKIFDSPELIQYISSMKFTGSVKGLRNGEIIHSNEPVLTITAPLIQGKILETPILNLLNHQILTATVSSRIVEAAKDRKVLFFGTRRAHGFEAAMSITRASYMTGCGSSNIIGEYFYNLRSTGTMTHAYIQGFGMEKESEYKAFDVYIKTFKEEKKPLIMLIDTYDTLKRGIVNAIAAFEANGIDDSYEGVYGIRIDSGNLEKLSKKCRELLLERGFYKAKIILTSGLDERKIKKLLENNAEADIFGVGDAISLPEKILSTVYKMSHIDGKDVMKVSNDEGKMSYPGNKNVYRLYEAGNVTDVVTLTEGGEEIGLKCGGNAKKLTVDYIIDGKICEDNVKLLNLEESKKYYESNKKYLKADWKMVFSKSLIELKEKLLSYI